MTDDQKEGLDTLSEGLSELSAGFQEISDELDAGLWRERLAKAWTAVTNVAYTRPDAAAWIGQWAPVAIALQGLVVTSGSLLLGLKAAIMNGEEFDLSDDFFQTITDDLKDVAEAFPDASTIIFGMETIDELIDATLDNEDARIRLQGIAAGVKSLIDDVMKKLLDVMLDGESGPETARDFANYVSSLEKVVQTILDRFWDAQIGASKST